MRHSAGSALYCRLTADPCIHIMDPYSLCSLYTPSLGLGFSHTHHAYYCPCIECWMSTLLTKWMKWFDSAQEPDRLCSSRPPWQNRYVTHLHTYMPSTGLFPLPKIKTRYNLVVITRLALTQVSGPLKLLFEGTSPTVVFWSPKDHLYRAAVLH